LSSIGAGERQRASFDYLVGGATAAPLKVTSAMAPGVTDRLWEMSDVADLLEAFEASQARCLCRPPL
jgi:hypothetical protein